MYTDFQVWRREAAALAQHVLYLSGTPQASRARQHFIEREPDALALDCDGELKHVGPAKESREHALDDVCLADKFA